MTGVQSAKAGTDDRGGRDDRGERDGWQWVLTGKDYKYFQCTSGRHGRDGYLQSRAQNGRYGNVGVFIGSGASSDKNSFTAPVSQLIGKTFNLAGYITESRTGLRSLVESGSNVTDTFGFSKYSSRSIRFEWLPKKSPADSGMADAMISAALSGTISAPSVVAELPIKLNRKITEQNGTTVVTITHVLNSTDPKKIAACAQHNAKGSYRCEFSEQCIYENGDCLPR